MKLQPRLHKLLNKEGKKPLLTLNVYKRHIVALTLLAMLAFSVYGVYFRNFMVLPQSAVNVMPKFPLSLEKQRILIISPHCDDESLGAAGLIQQALVGGSEIKVVVTTDCNRHKIGQVRKSESSVALSYLGLADSQLDLLNFPEVESNKKQNSKGQTLQSAFDAEIAGFKPTLIVAPHPDDTHIDHRSAGMEIKSLLKNKYPDITAAYYLIHYNFLKYPSPSGKHNDRYLLPPAKLITFDEKWYILGLTSEEEDKKQEAILKYKSQLSMKNPILHGILLDFIRENELFMIEDK